MKHYFSILLTALALLTACSPSHKPTIVDCPDDAVWTITASQLSEGDYYGITSANGQIGIISSREPLQIQKIVIGGLFDTYRWKKVSEYFENINPLSLSLTINGQVCSLANVTDYTQTFDYRSATLIHRFTLGEAQVEYRVCALRHMPYCYMSEVEVTAPESAVVKLTQRHEVPAILHNAQTETLHVIENEVVKEDEVTPEYDLTITTAQSPNFKHRVAAATTMIEQVDSVANGVIRRYTIYGTSIADNTLPDARGEAIRYTYLLAVEGRERTLARHQQAWNQLWQSDIVVDGNPQDQLDIHALLYHLYAFTRKNNPYSLSPMGLSGLGYYGHVFWDAELYIFPALCVLQPDLAQQIVDFRYSHLPQAKQNAYNHGYDGALYPWEDDDTGFETTPAFYILGQLEVHNNGSIAFAMWQYYCATGNQQWLRDKGYPVIAAIADYWTSRVEQDEHGQYHIRCAMGPDEWNINDRGGVAVDDNAYTTGCAIYSLQTAIKAAKVLNETPHPQWEQVAKNLDFVYMPNGIIAEHSLYHGERIKQADVTLLAYPLQVIKDTALIRRNVEYYLARIPVEQTPAMSKSINTTLYCRLGDCEKAYASFVDSYVPNLNPPFRVMAEFEGGTNPYFLTGAGGAIQSLLYGFAGLDMTDKGLKQVYQPCLPSGWNSLTIRRQGHKDIVITNNK